MARPLRIEYPGALYHVISRGNEQRAIVTDDADREKRLEWLKRTVRTYGWHLHAFVLMTNHEHLFVETPDANLSAGMQYLNGSYTSYFNRRRRRSGHLFQGRFKAHLIDEQGYFQVVSRYIHLNPVRAKVVARPQDYPWSSYAGYVRAGRALDWVTYERILMDFRPGNDSVRRRRYRQYVEAGLDEAASSPFADAVEGLILGSEAFVDRIKGLLADRGEDRAIPVLERLRTRPSLESIVEVALAQLGTKSEQWVSGHRSDSGQRAMAAYMCRSRYGYGCTEIAKALRFRHVSSVSRSVRHVEANISRYRGVLDKVEQELKKKGRSDANH